MGGKLLPDCKINLFIFKFSIVLASLFLNPVDALENPYVMLYAIRCHL